jgi:hypothetical protein
MVCGIRIITRAGACQLGCDGLWRQPGCPVVGLVIKIFKWLSLQFPILHLQNQQMMISSVIA